MVPATYLVMPLRGRDPDGARTFGAELDSANQRELEASCARIGIEGQSWSVASLRADAVLIGRLTGSDGPESVRRLAVSMHPFDLWLKRRLTDFTGLDLAADDVEVVSEVPFEIGGQDGSTSADRQRPAARRSVAHTP